MNWSSPFQKPARDSVIPAFAAVAVVAVLALGYHWYQAAAPCCGSDPADLAKPVPFDPSVRTGSLANGLRYYVQANASPAQRAELRLVVNAGSVFEDDRQLGLAHAVEHMAFRGTRRFPKHRMVDYLQAIGMRAGDDVNAHTGYDHTTYRLTVPTNRAGALDTGLAILRDWAHDVTFDSIEAKQEAGVVFEEWRSRSSDRIIRARDTLLLAGSPYARRAPIGDTLVLRRFDLAEMRRFYGDWYRPELMAVVAVGDFEAWKVESEIKRQFGSIPSSERQVVRPDFPVPAFASARTAVLSDPQVPRTRVALWYRRERSSPKTVREYRAALVEELMRMVLNDRLSDESDKPDAPVLDAGIVVWPLSRNVEGHVLSGPVAGTRVVDATAFLAEQVGRLQRFGVLEPELESAKASVFRDKRDAESHGSWSDDVADALVEHFLRSEPMLAADQDYELTKQLLEGIDTSDVAASARALSLDSSGVIIVTTKASRTDASSYTTEVLLAAARDGIARAVAIGGDTSSLPTLIEREPTPGSVASEHVLRDLTTFDWTLSNGMRVIIKPTDFADAHVVVRLGALGGASLASAEDYPSAFMSDQVLRAVGVGRLNGARLSRLYDARSISFSPSVADGWLYMTGSTSLANLESLFQVLHLHFTAPNPDAAAFARYRARSLSLWEDRAADPDAIFDDSVDMAMRPRDPVQIVGSPRFADAVSLERALGFWRARMANASNFTAVIVGDVTLERLRPLVERYLASLPAGGRERPREIGVRRPAGVTERSFRLGTEHKARTQIVFQGTVPQTPRLETTLRATRDLLELVLESRLRETMGGTYGVSVTLDLPPESPASYFFSVDFNAAPERVDSLARAAIAEIERIRADGPSDAEADKVKAAAAEYHTSRQSINRYWAGELLWNAQLEWPLETIRERRDEVAALSPRAFRDAARAYLDTRDYLRITMLPELPR